MLRNTLLATSLIAVCACGSSGPSAADINNMITGGTSAGGSSVTTGGSSMTTGGSQPVGVGGAGGSAVAAGGASGGSAGSTTVEGGAGGMTMGAGGESMGGSDMGGGGAGGSSEPPGPYSPREGSFKMLVFTRTAGYRHAGSIDTGWDMLQEIAVEQGFEIERADSEGEINDVVTTEGLMPFEVVFHLNTTGDFLNDDQQATYEEWMTNNDGAFVGVHSATDTENGWAFYSEVTGQYYDRHGPQNEPGRVQFEPEAAEFIVTKDLPNPWPRNEEWYNFTTHQTWSVKPGFTILGRKDGVAAGNGEPCMWTREWGNFRSFYTSLGHADVVFEDPQIKMLITRAIMWAVRRDHLIK